MEPVFLDYHNYRQYYCYYYCYIIDRQLWLKAGNYSTTWKILPFQE